MGIFGAMTTAITGLRSQSTALEHIANNIANSQTIGYKRTETSFAELVPESPANQQALGVVQAFSRPTNGTQGDISNSDSATSIAINGEGFFIVGEQSGVVDGAPTFTNESLYTRRGDFAVDRNGFLVNGTGYFLKGLPINSVTGNPTGSIPAVISISSDFLAAQATTAINYRANLASFPLTASADASIPLSERLNPSVFSSDPTTAGTGIVSGADASTLIDQSISGGAITTFDAAGQAINVQFRWAKLAPPPVTGTVDISGDLDAGGAGLTPGDSITLTIGTETFTIGFNNTGIAGVGEDVAIDLDGIDNLDGGGDDATGLTLRDAINTLFTGSPASLDGSNQLVLQSPSNTSVAFTGSDASVLTDLGMDAVGTGSATTRTIAFPETWNLFYLSDSTASGSTTAWRNAGTDYIFGNNGQLSPAISNITISNLTVNGNNIGDVRLDHGTNGITQFADSNGTASVTELSQDGFSAGELTAIAISDAGRVVASYTNGRSVDLALIVLADFQADSFLSKVDGGAFRETDESGVPILGAQGTITGNALESSNTDIADEFTKLIVTQQAYAANTRIISTSDEMIQEALNMIR
ncbi:flagellar hook protein FlgE [bacterium MnTg02]|nr:flagellar hook protein FlgE [bacterium MnTg02]